MTRSIDSTLGIRLVVFFLGTILYGMGLLQCWLYFYWYPRDSCRIKCVVSFLLFVETIQIAMLFATTYFHLITHFGHFQSILMITWMDMTQILGLCVSALIVQCYFAGMLYSLEGSNIYCTLLIVVLAVMSLGAGIGQIVLSHRLGTLGALSMAHLKKITACIQSSTTLVCDVLITVSLCFALSHHKSGMRSTNSILHILMVYAIGRGVLTAIAAAMNLILFLSLPGTLYFTLGFILSSKLYMNSMLFSLNSRQHIRNEGDRCPASMSINCPSFNTTEEQPHDNSIIFRPSTPSTAANPITQQTVWTKSYIG